MVSVWFSTDTGLAEQTRFGCHMDCIKLLFLHPFDNGVVSITSFKFSGTKNFRIWRSSMTRAFKGRNKLSFVDKAFPKLFENENKIHNRKHVNVVCSWIFGSITESLYANHASAEIAYDILSELSDTFHKVDGSSIFNIHKKNQISYSMWFLCIGLLQ